MTQEMRSGTRKVVSIGIGCIIGAALIAGAQTAHAKNYNLRVGAGHPAVLAYVNLCSKQFLPAVKKRVAAETGDTVSFTEAYGGSVAKLAEVFDVVESGLLDIGLLSTPFEPSNLYLQNFAYRAPFGEADPVEAGKISRKLYDTIPALSETLAKHNQVPLAVLNSSNYAMITNFEWKTLKDFAGHKILAAGANLRWLDNTEATPVQGSLGQVYNGIQTGVYDGMLIHYQGMNGFKIYEVAPYITKISFGSLPINMMTINKRTWDKLPAKIRTIIEEEGLKYEQAVNTANRDLDKTVIATMVQKGAKVFEVPHEVEVAWAKQLHHVPINAAKEGEKMGLPMKQVLEGYIEALKARGNKAAATYTFD